MHILATTSIHQKVSARWSSDFTLNYGKRSITWSRSLDEQRRRKILRKVLFSFLFPLRRSVFNQDSNGTRFMVRSSQTTFHQANKCLVTLKLLNASQQVTGKLIKSGAHPTRAFNRVITIDQWKSTLLWKQSTMCIENLEHLKVVLQTFWNSQSEAPQCMKHWDGNLQKDWPINLEIKKP